MKKKLIVLLLILSLLNLYSIYAHEGEKETSIYSFNTWITFASLLLGLIAAFYSINKIKEKNKRKNIIFGLIVLTTIAITSYISITTIYNNITSFSRGPVHWHADFEIWACNNLIEIQDPKNIFTNKIGSPEAHEHNDNRIHIEGLIKHREDALLGNFFRSIGGSISSNHISVPVHDQGVKTWINENLCNNKPAKFYMFVNEELNEEFDFYLIKPFANVPPGDKIKFVFTEKPLDEINKELGSAP